VAVGVSKAFGDHLVIKAAGAFSTSGGGAGGNAGLGWQF